jgi:hypothetical protein
MTKFSPEDIQKLEMKILQMQELIDNYNNSKTITKLSWAEINNIELKKLEDLIDKIRSKYLGMEAEKQKKYNPITSTPTAIIEPAIVERAVYNSRIETKNQKPENKYGNEDQKYNLEFHESFCS